ncbi:MAG: succinate dehydrogenase, hydrophobic membrane anchor protein [Robiginitomaculum sp.]|nr:MAG: succinate dehydrogenase, hydrophobic membrane anchor protein [Robiginitomaculum sp.]
MSTVKSSAGHKATHHFKTHKRTSLILALLTPFFLCGLMQAIKGEYKGFIDWITSPLGAVVLLAFITIGLYQSRHSMSEVIMDYASSEASLKFFLKLNTFACFVFWLVGVVAIIKIWLGA